MHVPRVHLLVLCGKSSECRANLESVSFGTRVPQTEVGVAAPAGPLLLDRWLLGWLVVGTQGLLSLAL